MEVREDIPTTNNSNEAYNNQWNQSTEPNASSSGLLSPTSYVKSPCRGKLIQPVVQTVLQERSQTKTER